MRVKSVHRQDTTSSSRPWLAWLLLGLLFVISVVVHFMLGDIWPKSAGVIPDEYGFLSMIREFACGDTITNTMDAHVSKFLYPLIASWFFDPSASLESQLKAINLVNSVMVASTVFPVYLLSKRILGGKHTVVLVLACLLSAFLPDSFYSMGIMAEPLALPIAFWWLWLASKFLDSTGELQFGLAAVIGVFSYVSYITKEYFVVYMISIVLMTVLRIIRELRGNDSNSAVRTVMALFVMLFAFAIPFVITQVNFFHDIAGNSYSRQLSQDNLKSDLTLSLIVFYVAVLVSHVMLAGGVIPFFSAVWKKSDGYSLSNARLGQMLIVLLVLMSVVIVYTIMIREDADIPRVILRYYSPLLFTLVLLAFSKLLTMSGHDSVFMMLCDSWISVVVFAGTACAALGAYQYDMEATDLLWLSALLSSSATPLGVSEIDLGILIGLRVVVLLIIVAILVIAALNRINGRDIGVLCVVFMIVTWAVSAVLMANVMFQAHSISQEDYEEACEVEQLIKEWDESSNTVPIVIWERHEYYNRWCAYYPALRHMMFEVVDDPNANVVLYKADLETIEEYLANKNGTFMLISDESSEIIPDNIELEDADVSSETIYDGRTVNVYDVDIEPVPK